MKRLLSIITALAVFIPVASFGDEALDEFKKEITEAKAMSDAFEKKSKENPAVAFGLFGEFVKAMGEIETDGLPDDIKVPWAGMMAGLGKMAAALSELPTDAAALEKKFGDAAFMEAFGKKMDAIAEEMKPHVAKLSEAGKKHGIPALDQLVPK